MFGAAILSVGLLNSAVAELPLLPDAADYAGTASGWLLDGRALPPDYRVTLLEMSPEARLQTLIFLRRVGLLQADGWALQDILRPAIPAEVNE